MAVWFLIYFQYFVTRRNWFQYCLLLYQGSWQSKRTEKLVFRGVLRACKDLLAASVIALQWLRAEVVSAVRHCQRSANTHQIRLDKSKSYFYFKKFSQPTALSYSQVELWPQWGLCAGRQVQLPVTLQGELTMHLEVWSNSTQLAHWDMEE